MKILGLTGSIAMGKSTLAMQFRQLGVPVFDADATVHRLTGPGGNALAAIGEVFPDVMTDGVLDRKKLGRKVFSDSEKLETLEAILHPLVQLEERRFVVKYRKLNTALVVLDIPLLFETGADSRTDAVAVVTAPAFLQKQRALRRPDMTEAKFQAILKQQMPDRQKRCQADFIIHTGLGKGYSLRRAKQIIHDMTRETPCGK